MLRHSDCGRWACSAALLLLTSCNLEPLHDAHGGATSDGDAPGSAGAPPSAQVSTTSTPASSYGTIRGKVLDARTGAPVGRGKVTAVAACTGGGCSSATAPSVEVTSGAFVFDAYATAPARLTLTDETAFTAEDASGELVPVKIGHGQLQYQRDASRSGQFVTQIPDLYLCPKGAADSDSDGICDLAEGRYGTNARLADTDGDALTDQDELYGRETSKGGKYDIRQLGADPRHSDVFVEVDYMPGLRPSDAALGIVVDAFKNAPRSNPDGKTGVSLHVLVDQQIASADRDDDLNLGWVGVWEDVETLKSKYFNRARTFAFHYALFAAKYNASSSSGLSRFIPAADFVVTLGSTPGSVADQAGTFMHELGHNLGLQHGGHDDSFTKPHYVSVMSYYYQFAGIEQKPPGASASRQVYDYARFGLQGFSESKLDELTAYAPVDTTEAVLLGYVRPYACNRQASDGTCASPIRLDGTLSANLDFNQDSRFTSGVARDIDGDGSLTTFAASQADWPRLVFNGGEIGMSRAAGASGASRRVVSPPCPAPPQRTN